MENGSSEGTTLNQKKEKLNCEILKLQAEAKKLDAERFRIKQSSKFFSRPFVLKSILAIILFGPIMWFYYHEIFLPIMQKENIELALKNAKNEKKIAAAQDSLSQSERKHQDKVNQLKIERKIAESKHAKIDQAYKKLYDDHGKLREDYNEIAHRLDKSKIDRETIESEKNRLLLRLESTERTLSILSTFYKAYSAITSSINLYIVPEFKYEGKIHLSPEIKRYIKLMPNALKAECTRDTGGQRVKVMEKTEEWLADESVIQQFSAEEQKDLKREANYKVTGAILKFEENSFLARFEVTALLKDGTEEFVISFIQQMPIEYEIPFFGYGSFSVVRDRILKYILMNKLQKRS